MKRFSSAAVVFLIVFIIICSFTLCVNAEVSLSIPEWVVDSHLLKSGDLFITEDISFRFESDANGVFREIVLEKTSGVSDIQVEELLGNATKQYKLVKDAEKGDSDVFQIINESSSTVIKIFSPAEEGQIKTFRISYTVRNVAVKYNDIGELYYIFLGKENNTPIGSFRINIKLPENVADEHIKIFAHGPLNGEYRKINSNTITLYVEDVPANTFIEGRILFPKEIIPLSSNIQNINNYENILREEASYQRKITEDRERREKIKKMLEPVSLLASVIGIFIFIIFLTRFRREKYVYKNDNKNEQFPSIPEDCTPAVASYLTTGSFLGINTVFATILDLIRKGYLKISIIRDEFIKFTDADNYIITQVKETDDSLLSHEKYFINWLINEMGNGKSISTQEIEYNSKHSSLKFHSSYNKWKTKVGEDAVSKGYYDKSKTGYGVLCLFFSIALLIIGILTLAYDGTFGIVSLIISITLFAYGIALFYRRSDYGYQQYKKWVEFIKYVKNHKDEFSTEFTKEDFINSPDISLIYALSLGQKINSEEFIFDESYYAYGYYNNSWFFWYLIINNSNDNAFQKSIHKSFGGSTGSSSGGSFTGGGGGGAGGGGAGGF
ncbi:MAG TPA: DUF2207 domain-containing protein [Clostridiaceae bacterium]|nr:DUF2207 domain-containing protein [Clostridiaceae bacterium]